MKGEILCRRYNGELKVQVVFEGGKRLDFSIESVGCDTDWHSLERILDHLPRPGEAPLQSIEWGRT